MGMTRKMSIDGTLNQKITKFYISKQAWGFNEAISFLPGDCVQQFYENTAYLLQSYLSARCSGARISRGNEPLAIHRGPGRGQFQMPSSGGDEPLAINHGPV